MVTTIIAGSVKELFFKKNALKHLNIFSNFLEKIMENNFNKIAAKNFTLAAKSH